MPLTQGEPSRLSEAERREILYVWNETQEEFPGLCVHELFERQVERDPDAVAVVFAGRRLTYRELNQRANQVAHFLRKHGVGPESLVGVSLRRCPELVVGLLGVWKAGGAYVPLDPAYPPERLAFMASDAGILMLLTEASCKSLFPSASAKAICLDSDWPTLEQEPTSNPSAGAVPSNLAYVMYTSGSTGQPKGAMILHRGLVNYLCWAIKAYGVEAGGSVPVHSSISFDLTVTSLYPILLAGGHAELLPEDVGAQNLLSSLRRQGRHNLVKITPAHLDLISQQLKAEETGGVTKAFVIGGENLLAESVQLWRDFAPHTRLINEYGPTETVVGCCVYEVKPGDPESGSIPIGRPIANTQLYVLDPEMEPVPVGAMGELYIGGAGVARGYLNRPELTQERFLIDRFSGKEGARLYKTGDLARYRRDGTLEYLGRVDNQVKIRGYRIELGEIEETLTGHPAVQSCVVLAREDSPGNRQLVGYVVLRQGEHEAVESLSDFLKQRLPEYMVPAQFVLLGSFPLTQNGKVDRKALPAPAAAGVVPGGTTAAPRNDTEKALVTIWAKLLNIGTVGIHDDFFELGGHSLLVIKAMSRVRDALHVDLPPLSLFENSTVAELAAVVMEAKGTVEESPTQEVRRIEPRKQPGPWPASFSQEQFWLLDQMVPGSPAYNVVDVIDLHGDYHASELKRAFSELVSRHEALRTSFMLCDGQLMQAISPASDLDLPEFDLGAFPESRQEREWTRVVREETRRPFDLSQPSLIRATVFHLSMHEHKVLLTAHHIVVDEWSLGLIHDEVTRLYAAFSQNRSSPLSPLPAQYADFACWQRKSFGEARLADQIAYWKKELEGASAALTLPTDKPRPATPTLRGATEHFVLPKAVLDSLRALGLRAQTTLFMVLEAAFASLLYRYSGQSDILVGTPISGRTQSEMQRMVGCFLNTVVLRSQFDDAQTFRTLLRQTRERALGAFAHAELPFGHLVATLASDRDPSRTPLFQVMFVLFDPDGVSRFTNLSAHRELETGTSKFDLTLSASITENGLGGEIEYSTDLFEAETIRRMGRHFGALLEEIARDADRSISSLPILAESERRQLLVEWNATRASYPREVPLAKLVEAQVERTPDAVAVVFGEKSLSFAELNAQANQLARALVAQGAGPDRVVGLYVERSVEMVVALLAVVKAGAAYLPVDPLLPEERSSYMLEDSGASLVVTEKSLRGTLPTFSGSVVLLDDEDWKSNSRENLAVAVQPDHLAYVIYTSGSTGKPKGVEVPRGALTNLLWSMRDWLGLTAEDRLLAVTTISFDIAGADMWLPLLVGARMVVASREEAVDGASLREHIDRHGITFLQATPISWRLLLEAGWEGKSDIQIVCTGEAMPRDLAMVLQPMVRRLWNLYGPTETTIWSTGYQVRDGSQPILIGRPVANTQCYILDEAGQPVPIGVVGELYIAGDGLARGYHARPELTAEKFLRDPFNPQPGARMYRTGDLARYLADSNIECLGRTDHQVKIRGYRIELGEIECVLAKHPTIEQAVMVAWEAQPGVVRLVAYVKPSGDSISESELRAHLRQSVPDYMVPQHFVMVEAFPTTPNGKIDRKALPTPQTDDSGVFVAETYVEPRSELERRLTEVWRHVLGVERLGIRDSFFDIGGQSLLAVKLLGQISRVFGKRMPLTVLLEAPTVEQLAKHLEDTENNDGVHSLVPLQATGTKAPLYWIPGGAALGLFTFSHDFIERLGPDQPVYGLASAFPKNAADIERVEQRAARYLKLIRRKQPHGPYNFNGFCAGGTIAFEMAQQLLEQGEEVGLLNLVNCWCPAWGALNALWFKAQRLQYHLRMAREKHQGLSTFGLERFAKWREARSEREDVARAVRKAKRDGFVDSDSQDVRVITRATGDVIAQYRVKFYPGQIALCISNEPSLQGISRYADPRLAWIRYALAHKVHMLTGDHDTVLDVPHVFGLADVIRDSLQIASVRRSA
ncbi:MAG TPA: amino acid adenylation domain-containing protein [Polyangia bacterium]